MRSLRQRLRVRLWIPEVDGSVTYVGVLGLEFRQSRFLEITVRWTIKLEFTPDGGEPQVRQIGTINRSMTDVRPEGVGLTLQEGRQLLRGIECQVIANQVHLYTLCFRACPDCGRRRQFKDVRTKCVQTVFGAYRFRGRRIRTCACEVEQGHPASFFPLGVLIPRRTTPEVRFLFAELGARMPYREASRMLGVCGFDRMRASRTTIWRHPERHARMDRESRDTVLN
jgi:hypothetical protein